MLPKTIELTSGTAGNSACCGPPTTIAADRGATLSARLPGALVYTVFELKESPYTLGVHVVRDRGTAQPDRMLQHLAQRDAKPLQFGPGQPPGSPSRADPGPKQAFVRVDIAHSREQALVEQRRLDGQAAVRETGVQNPPVQW